jgi:hypothetical protein
MTRKINMNNAPFAALIIVSLMAGMGCTKHYANNITQVKPTASASSTTSLAEMLHGTWKLDRIDVPAESTNASGSQAEKDAQGLRITKYQNVLRGLNVIFKDDGTYQMIINGQSDIGTWKVKEPNNIEGLSKTTKMSVEFQNATVAGDTLTVKYDPGDGPMLIILLKQ